MGLARRSGIEGVGGGRWQGEVVSRAAGSGKGGILKPRVVGRATNRSSKPTARARRKNGRQKSQGPPANKLTKEDGRDTFKKGVRLSRDGESDIKKKQVYTAQTHHRDQGGGVRHTGSQRPISSKEICTGSTSNIKIGGQAKRRRKNCGKNAPRGIDRGRVPNNT